MLALDTGDTEMLVDTAADEIGLSFSANGPFFAVFSDETGEFEVIVREVSSGRTFPFSTNTRGGRLRDDSAVVWEVRSRLGPEAKAAAGPLGDAWFLDGVFVTIRGERHYLWRAVDQDGDV